MLDITELFVFVDDICKKHEEEWLTEQVKIAKESGRSVRKRETRMSISEICTILIEFHRSSVRNFKHFYVKIIQHYWKSYFPNALSYTRFMALANKAILPLLCCLESLRGTCTGLSFVDATAIAVCKNKRIPNHRVFDGYAKRGKTTMGWFFGFKLHIIINESGALVSWVITPGNIDDRAPLEDMSQNIFGDMYGDKGYISQTLFEKLFERGLRLVTRLKKNMKNKLISDFDKAMLRKRALIESVNDQLKNISMLEHTRHRSLWSFMNNVLCSLIAYSLQAKKPSITDQIFKGEQDEIIVI